MWGGVNPQTCLDQIVCVKLSAATGREVTMNKYVQQTESVFEKEEICYSELEDNLLAVGFTCENERHVGFHLIFNEETDESCDDSNHMQIYACIDNANVRNVYNQALVLCNDLNREYRWAKFCIDNEYDITCEADAILGEDNAGKQCHELMMRLMHIINTVYPRINQLIEFGAGAGRASAPAAMVI